MQKKVEAVPRIAVLALILVSMCATLLLGSCGAADVSEAAIVVRGDQEVAGDISPLIYGGFIEFTREVINGRTGLWAQELCNRGFDEPDTDSDGISGGEGSSGRSWYSECGEGVRASFSIIAGGYNQRGEYLQRISKEQGDGETGLFQYTCFSQDCPMDFYVYMRGDSSAGEVTARLTDESGEEVFAEAPLGVPSREWSKREATFPAISQAYGGRLEIAFSGNGSVELDEASLMFADNVGGVREEVFELYRELAPGVLRYPGGCFADDTASHWTYGVGPIDQRRSPNWDGYWKDYQRMDFGTDEFLSFCEAIGAEAHMVVNFGDGTVKETAAWVAYANGDPLDATVIGVDERGTDWKTVGFWAGQREANGRVEPYGVKYWEI